MAGADGGGTRTTLVLADPAGRTVARREGPPGLVDPRRPLATAVMLYDLLRGALADAGAEGRPVALCAGLAGVGNAPERDAVEAALAAYGAAERVRVVSDGEIALEGALAGGPGILLVAGTGSVAYGRAEDGRLARCGGWGMIVGDEGSGYAIGRDGLAAALRGSDGRGPETVLLPRLLQLLGVHGPDGIPPWAGRAEKAQVAALSTHVVQAAEEGDAAALAVVGRAAEGLAAHAEALACRLSPWSAPVPLVMHGGVAGAPFVARCVMERLEGGAFAFDARPAAADAVTGALRFARALAAGG